MFSQIDQKGLIVLAAVFSTLALGTLVTWLLSSRLGAKAQGLKDRIWSWWVIVILFSIGICLNRTVSMIFFAFVSFTALKEYFSLIRSRRSDRGALFWAYLAIPVQYYLVGQGSTEMFLVFLPVVMLLFISVRLILAGETDGFIRSVGTIHWGLMMTVFAMSHLAALLTLPPEGHPVAGASLVLYVVVLTQFNDVAQFLWGKSLGKHKIAPHVSPGKTWGGFLGGMGTTVALSALVGPWLVGIPWHLALLGGFIMSAGGFFGDLCESAVKRDLRVKDSGALLPGHGGILDRIDSLMFTGPLMYHFIGYFCF